MSGPVHKDTVLPQDAEGQTFATDHVLRAVRQGDLTIRSGSVFRYSSEGEWLRVGHLRALALDTRQKIVTEWGARCFGAENMAPRVRAARFLEEAVELVQASGLPRDHARRVLSYVYSRPVGEVAQEAGGAANTLMALCSAHGLSLDACQRVEIERCLMSDPARFEERNLRKLREVDAAVGAGADPWKWVLAGVGFVGLLYASQWIFSFLR